MKTIIKITVLGICLGILFVIDVPPELPLRVEVAPEAHAILGVRRRAFRRGAIIGAGAAATEASYAAEAAQAQPAAAPPPAVAPATAPAAAPAPAAETGGKPLPLGTVVNSLPAGCSSEAVGGVNYYHCGGNYYRAVFQGNNLVYVTAKP
jgi:hypothetical protein